MNTICLKSYSIHDDSLIIMNTDIVNVIHSHAHRDVDILHWLNTCKYLHSFQSSLLLRDIHVRQDYNVTQCLSSSCDIVHYHYFENDVCQHLYLTNSDQNAHQKLNDIIRLPNKLTSLHVTFGNFDKLSFFRLVHQTTLQHLILKSSQNIEIKIEMASYFELVKCKASNKGKQTNKMIIRLPESLQSFVTDGDIESLPALNNLHTLKLFSVESISIHHLTHLRVLELLEISDIPLPPTLEALKVDEYTGFQGFSNTSLLRLEIFKSENPLRALPFRLKYLRLHHDALHSTCALPETLEYFRVDKMLSVRKKWPNNLKHIHLSFSHCIIEIIICHLPSQLHTLKIKNTMVTFHCIIANLKLRTLIIPDTPWYTTFDSKNVMYSKHIYRTRRWLPTSLIKLDILSIACKHLPCQLRTLKVFTLNCNTNLPSSLQTLHANYVEQFIIEPLPSALTYLHLKHYDGTFKQKLPNTLQHIHLPKCHNHNNLSNLIHFH